MAQGNLRNRKQQQVKETSSSPTVTEEHEEVVSPRRHEQEQEDEGDDHAYFRLTPLIQRSVWMRLDVGPFLLAYAGLITFDSLESISDFTLLGFAWTTIAFAATLLLHLTTVLWTQWSIPMRADVGYSFSSSSTTTDSVAKQWTHCLVQTAHKEMDGSTVAGIVPVIHESKQGVTITFQDRVFRCCLNPPDVDVTLWSCSEKKPAATTTQQPRFRPVQYPIHLPLQWYASVWQGHTSLPSCTAANQVYGRNTTALKLPAFIELLAEQTVAPFFLFQVFCVVLWSLDEYWYYALFTLFALILFESTVAYNRLKSLERLHAISHRNQYQRVWVRRGMDASHVAWMSIPVAELVPGDWISLSGSHVHVPADILLLHGTAVCDEALLTGESVPQLKQPLDSNAATATTSLDMQDVEHKESILFGGTVLLVGTPLDGSPEQLPPDKGITGIVLRTGFETAQGNLLRTMAHTSKSSVGVHTADTFVFILILIFCAIGAAAYVLNEGWYDERRNRFRLMLHVVIIITSVIPPELPMELSLAVTNSVADLMKRSQVYCTEHFRIPWAGEVNVCCFDKTGTL
jgi:manganese-transporting P-type ATPase